MVTFQDQVAEYRKLLEKGQVQQAYKGLLEFVMHLRAYFKNKYPGFSVPSSIYYGYMDMTYFSLVPEALKGQGLKIAIVFIHETCRFEAWLAGVNKQVQANYWKLIKESGWDKYRIVPTTRGFDSIIEHILADNPDFNDLDELTSQIERETLEFITDIEKFLADR